MKYTLIILLSIVFCSCSDSFINHTLTYKKIGACTNEETPINMNSNINGERYEFESCIDDNFGGNISIERKGDSVIVKLPNGESAKSSFKLTLDIDAKPAYHHIILDGREVLVSQEQLMNAQ